MTASAVAFSANSYQGTPHPEYLKGKAYLDQIKIYLDDQDISYEEVSDKCLSIKNKDGKECFIRLYFNQNSGAWSESNVLFTLGVYNEPNSSFQKQYKMEGEDRPVGMLLTTHRRRECFEKRTSGFLRQFLGIDNLPDMPKLAF
jgi:hypothetical protein